jgi:hypothetical protein
MLETALTRGFPFRRARFRTILRSRVRVHLASSGRGGMPLTEPAGVYRPPPPRAHSRLPAVRGALRALRPGVRGTLRGAGGVAAQGRPHSRRGVPRLRPAGGRLRADPLPEQPGGAPARVLLPHAQLLSELPGQARSAVFAEHVITEILEPVPHRHVVVTIPSVLRGLFQRERRLLGRGPSTFGGPVHLAGPQARLGHPMRGHQSRQHVILLPGIVER